MAAGTETLKRTPLHDRHVGAGAKLVPFAGWEMPVQYAGIRAEHMAVRERVGIFDVSHMGEIETSGPGAEALLQRLLSNDVARIADSCGYGVPLMSYEGGRPHQDAWAAKRLRTGGAGALADYQAEKNAASIDGLPAVAG